MRETELTESTTINYLHFFQNLLEVAPWPVLIVDRSLSICFHSQLALQLFNCSDSLQDIKLDQLVQDPVMIQLVQECI